MEFEWSEVKRQTVLAARGLDFINARTFFDGRPLIAAGARRSDSFPLANSTVL